MKTDYQTYSDSTGSHQYEIGVGDDGETKRFVINANSRSQAADKIKRDGHVVRDVNMIG